MSQKLINAPQSLAAIRKMTSHSKSVCRTRVANRGAAARQVLATANLFSRLRGDCLFMGC